jgi:hypothetical protein
MKREATWASIWGSRIDMACLMLAEKVGKAVGNFNFIEGVVME